MQPAPRCHQPALGGVASYQHSVLDAQSPDQGRDATRTIEKARGSAFAQVAVAPVALDLSARPPLALQDHHGQAQPAQFEGERQPGDPGPGDDDGFHHPERIPAPPASRNPV